jgi:GTP-binding protein
VYGRGVLHLSVLIETMRREGYELQVGKPQVIIKHIDDVKCEPYEIMVIDVPEEYASKAINLVTQRKGDLMIMEPKGDLQHLEFYIPSRGIIGLRNSMLTATAGQAIMTHRFKEYAPFKGSITGRTKGAITSMETGSATAFALNRLQDRGVFFVDPTEVVYKGQVIGEHSRDNDLDINVVKGKQLTNMRKSGTDDAMKIAPKIKFSLEECMEYIKDDEYLEITPKSLRMRKIG